MTVAQIPAPNTSAPSTPNTIISNTQAFFPFLVQARYRLLLGGIASVLLALLTMLVATNAYAVSYDLFRGIALVNSTTVDSSERALQYLARVSQAAADYAVLTSDTPLYEEAQNIIFRDFALFRDEMFTLRGNLQTADEETAYTVAETYTDSRFWRHVSNLLAQRSNDSVARAEYLSADNHVRSWITPALQELENLNFQQMVEAGDRAGIRITGQILLVGFFAIASALLLTYISFQLRRQVRRYFTPGIDAAVVLGWVLALAMFINLSNAPGRISVMIQDAYRSVTGSSRVLVDANLANRAESSALLDVERADAWYARFDEAVARLELRMCGQPNCMERSFVSFGNQPSTVMVDNARAISPENSARIEGIIPLVGNITFGGEAAALEAARVAFQEYREVNAKLRELIGAGSADEAIALNTSLEQRTSQDAFNRFAAAMETERTINHDVFDQVWTEQSALLQTNGILFGFAGYALLIVLVIAGVAHRYREL